MGDIRVLWLERLRSHETTGGANGNLAAYVSLDEGGLLLEQNFPTEDAPVLIYNVDPDASA
jgi:hypothetical protein